MLPMSRTSPRYQWHFTSRSICRSRLVDVF